MAFTDPLVVDLGYADPLNLNRVNVGNNGSEYRDPDNIAKITASSTYGKRNRRVIRIDHTKNQGDQFTGQYGPTSMSNYIVFDTPPYGWTIDEQVGTYEGFTTLLSASSHALITKLLGGES
jgi:hypothetical protein